MQISNDSPATLYSNTARKSPESKNTGNSFADIFNSLKQTQGLKHGLIEEAKPVESNASSGVMMHTNLGQKDIDLDAYFSKESSQGSINLKDVPLLLPTQHNVETLSKYAEQKFKQLLSDYNIPEPPATMEFDGEGNMVLPSDYPYTDALKQAFSEQPAAAEALRTTAAVASHYAGIMEGQAWRDEMSLATTQAERDSITEKYSYLFDDNRPATKIIFKFLEDGSMLIGGDNPTLNDTLKGEFWSGV